LKSNSKKRRSQKTGLPPGTLVSISEHAIQNPEISVYHYSADKWEHQAVLPKKAEYIDALPKTWINLDGFSDTTMVEKIGELFGIHSLALEDVVNTEQRSKLDHYEDHFSFILKMIQYRGQKLEMEQVSLVLGQNWLVSFQEGLEGDVFGSVRKRLETNHGAMRQKGVDFLFYSLVDIVVDHYFVSVEQIGDEVEHLEEMVTDHPAQITVGELHRIKRNLMLMRKAVWPLRDALIRLDRESTSLVRTETLPFLRDVSDHVIQVIEMIDAHREILTSLLEVYLSQLSLRQNNVMQRLTVLASYFLPLTFIVGIYGMNFDHMPELHWKYGYLYSWIVMGLVTGGLAIWFKWKKWDE